MAVECLNVDSLVVWIGNLLTILRLVYQKNIIILVSEYTANEFTAPATAKAGEYQEGMK